MFQYGDRFIRRITPTNRDTRGRPTPGAFRGKDGRTSVYLERLLAGRPVPSFRPGDWLAYFPVAWVYDKQLTKTALRVEWTSGAHFDIVGTINIEFAHYLRTHAEIVIPHQPAE